MARFWARPCKSVPGLLQSGPGTRTNQGSLGIEYSQDTTLNPNPGFDLKKNKHS